MLALVLVGMMTATVLAEGPVDSIHLEIKGKVTTGVVAIGAETTGVVIATPGGFSCELAGKVDEKLNGKVCHVKGTFQIKQGVEVRARNILTIASIEAVEAKPEEQTVQAAITGKLQTGVLAPSGVTTGVQISASGAVWELDIKDKEQRALADKLNGQTIKTTGSVEVKKVATSPRMRTIVTVKTLESAEKK
jgi:hypothetical protein